MAGSRRTPSEVSSSSGDCERPSSARHALRNGGGAASFQHPADFCREMQKSAAALRAAFGLREDVGDAETRRVAALEGWQALGTIGKGRRAAALAGGHLEGGTGGCWWGRPAGLQGRRWRVAELSTMRFWQQDEDWFERRRTWLRRRGAPAAREDHRRWKRARAKFCTAEFLVMCRILEGGNAAKTGGLAAISKYGGEGGRRQQVAALQGSCSKEEDRHGGRTHGQEEGAEEEGWAREWGRSRRLCFVFSWTGRLSGFRMDGCDWLESKFK